MVKVINCSTLADAYKESIQYIIWNYNECETEDNEVVWRSKDTIVIHVTNPQRDLNLLADYYPMGIKSLDKYADEILGIDDRPTLNTKNDFDYSYYERLSEYTVLTNDKVECPDGLVRYYTRLYVVDQIEEMVKKLNKTRNTRRACTITWRPHEDNHRDVSVPCLQWIKCEITHEDKLNMYTVWRSRDILLGMGANIYALHFLHAKIAMQCKCSIGFYEDISVDAHIYYKRDMNYLKRWLS